MSIIFCIVAFATSLGTPLADERMPHCGVASLYYVCQWHNIDVSSSEIEASILAQYPNARLTELSMEQVLRTAENLGLHAAALKVDRLSITQIPLPAILHVRPERIGHDNNTIGHMAILSRIDSDSARVFDLTDSVEPIVVSPEEFWSGWDGELIVVSTKPISFPKPPFPVWLTAGVSVACTCGLIYCAITVLRRY